MPISADEAIRMKTDIEILKNSTTQCLIASKDAANASKLVAEQIGNLLLEMKEHDIRDEYRAKEFNELKESIKTVNTLIEATLQVFNRSKDMQKRIDSVWDGMSSNLGKLAVIALIIGIVYMLGLDPSKIIK